MGQNMKITIKCVVVIFTVSGADYYTYQNYDPAVSEATNIDNASRAIEKAIASCGMIEGHDAVTGSRVFVNLKEATTAAIKCSKLIELFGNIDC